MFSVKLSYLQDHTIRIVYVKQQIVLLLLEKNVLQYQKPKAIETTLQQKYTPTSYKAKLGFERKNMIIEDRVVKYSVFNLAVILFETKKCIVNFGIQKVK